MQTATHTLRLAAPSRSLFSPSSSHLPPSRPRRAASLAGAIFAVQDAMAGHSKPSLPSSKARRSRSPSLSLLHLSLDSLEAPVALASLELNLAPPATRWSALPRPRPSPSPWWHRPHSLPDRLKVRSSPAPPLATRADPGAMQPSLPRALTRRLLAAPTSPRTTTSPALALLSATTRSSSTPRRPRTPARPAGSRTRRST